MNKACFLIENEPSCNQQPSCLWCGGYCSYGNASTPICDSCGTTTASTTCAQCVNSGYQYCPTSEQCEYGYFDSTCSCSGSSAYSFSWSVISACGKRTHRYFYLLLECMTISDPTTCGMNANCAWCQGECVYAVSGSSVCVQCENCIISYMTYY